jgi:hypothetical protein
MKDADNASIPVWMLGIDYVGIVRTAVRIAVLERKHHDIGMGSGIEGVLTSP